MSCVSTVNVPMCVCVCGKGGGGRNKTTSLSLVSGVPCALPGVVYQLYWLGFCVHSRV